MPAKPGFLGLSATKEHTHKEKATKTPHYHVPPPKKKTMNTTRALKKKGGFSANRSGRPAAPKSLDVTRPHPRHAAGPRALRAKSRCASRAVFSTRASKPNPRSEGKMNTRSLHDPSNIKGHGPMFEGSWSHGDSRYTVE